MNALLQPVPKRWSSPVPAVEASRFLATVLHFFRYRSPDQMAAFLIAVAALSLSWWNILDAPGYQDDEGTYTAQALSTLHGSLAPYTYWYDHPPLGWVQLAALAWLPGILGLGGEVAVGQMRYVVALYFVASTVLVFLIARRLNLRLPFAVLAALLYCISPLSLVLGRQVFIDNVGLPWLLLAFYLVLSPQLKLWDHVGAAACFAVAVLSKETLAIFGPALLVALLHRPKWETRSFSLIGFLSVGGLILGFFPLLAILQGELVSGPGHVSLQDALAYQFVSRPGSGSILDAGSGRQELVLGWMYYDNLLLLLGAAAAAVCLAQREARWIPAALLLFAAPVLIGHGYLPGMYIIAAIPFLALATSVAADFASRILSKIFGLVRLPGRQQSPLAAPGQGPAALVAANAVLILSLALVVVPPWSATNQRLMAGNENADWNKALEWSKENLPKDDVALVPYSMWQDLNADGRHDPWKVIAIEKMDLDSDFAERHPDGWRSVDWIVEGPPTRRNVTNLGLENAGQALENSSVVAAFGDWKVRKVLPGGTPSATGEGS
ncbi:ArnT family glycosyltransferase [Arthrobacter nitrophenolicus]|uniref:Uncharacterized protein n=2 Tax=Arthrobacter nitrophenolicus TaxID=683150 RepID=A0ACC6TDC2_9MICC|nr:glycosyltransferase family 39 protein [Arthrobacter nitrophenolicus]ELT45935.1 hypothetical protein G205_01743 [Arthrobacter nitrophenolicus]